MKANENALQARVRQVINETGLTHVQFAMEIGLDPDKLSKSLNGVRRFTSYELAVIAERGRTTVDWLLSGVEPEKITLAARTQERGVQSGLEEALSRAKQVAGVHEILRRLRIIPPTPPVLPKASMTGLAIEDGPRLAKATLAVLEKEASRQQLREDPAEVMERVLGINVLIEAFGEGFDGLACTSPSFRLAIVNSEIPWSRQRFTLLHECAHIIAGDGADRNLCIDGDVMGAGDRVDEMRANAFAAAVLMPEDDIRAHVQKPVGEETFAQLVGRYRVSPDAMAWRLKSLGFIDTRERAKLGAMPIQQAALRGGWTEDYRDLTRDQSLPRLPLTLAGHAVDAFVSGTISARPVAKLLEVDSSTLLEWHARSRLGAPPGDADSTAANDEMAVFVP
jgi:Zn-dependent peptidase ImmA (M78 family)